MHVLIKLLYCSLDLLFRHVLAAVAIVVCLRSLLVENKPTAPWNLSVLYDKKESLTNSDVIYASVH